MPPVAPISEYFFDSDSDDALNLPDIPSSSTTRAPSNSVRGRQRSTLRQAQSRRRKRRRTDRSDLNSSTEQGYTEADGISADGGYGMTNGETANARSEESDVGLSTIQPQSARLLDILPTLEASSATRPETSTTRPIRSLPRMRRPKRDQVDDRSVDLALDIDMSSSRARDEEIRALLNLPMTNPATTNHSTTAPDAGSSALSPTVLNGQATSSSADATNPPNPTSSLVPVGDYQCPICFCSPTQACITACGHVMCGECLFSAVRSSKERHVRLYGRGNAITWPGGRDADGRIARCPVCRAVLKGWNGRGGGVTGILLGRDPPV
ncbi:hypothetical protein FRC14_002945 [Serendipita sp. 396]|nr:hypothetical protein FRC14_002945 [Serendipita sp. 396]KAG8784057.1 hypothetical protein FRC15_004081 [Serendipita sp. 397]KAG8799925.1 hypothetical protein FRC16_004097 [Serendipita sp. 398]KAG8868482.1 hypothetical protein FRC20_003289 [Serendipita sp. 405]